MAPASPRGLIGPVLEGPDDPRLGLVRERLAAQHLGPRRASSPTAAVRALLAVQAQEYLEVRWSLAQRSGRAPTEEDVEAAFRDAALVRTHVLRPTWHAVDAADLRLLLRLTKDHVRRRLARRHRELGLDDELLARALHALDRVLADGVPRTRDELATALARDHGLDLARERLGHTLLVAELEAVVVSGPRAGAHHAYVPFDARVPPDTARAGASHDELLAELARRYVTGHGPASAADLGWWAGLPMAEARRALAAAGDALETREDPAGGPPLHVAATPRAPGRAPPTGALLLGCLDEAHIAFKGLRLVLAAPLPRRETLMRPVVHEGVTVGAWRRTATAKELLVEVEPFGALGEDARAALDAEVARFGAFAGLPARLDVRPSG